MRTKYGRKKIREEKKVAIDPLNRVRDKILSIKVELESGDSSYRTSYFDPKELADELKMSYGEADRCLMQLFHEGLVSDKSGRRKLRSVRYTPIEEPEAKKHVALFNYKKCPICENELTKEERKYVYNRFDYIYSCSNGCYTQGYNDVVEDISIFDDKYNVYANDHNSVRGEIKVQVNKKIEYWKKNNRYIARNLLGEWED